jgi:hypothetical protein
VYPKRPFRARDSQFRCRAVFFHHYHAGLIDVDLQPKQVTGLKRFKKEILK